MSTTSEAVAAAVADARLEGIELALGAAGILEQLESGHIDARTAGHQVLARHNIAVPVGHPFA